jgi:hypothetical protein
VTIYYLILLLIMLTSLGSEHIEHLVLMVLTSLGSEHIEHHGSRFLLAECLVG